MLKALPRVMLTLFSLSDGREYMQVKEYQAEKMHRRPQVEELKCRMCLLSNPNAQICIAYGGNLQLGWQFEQAWYDDYLTVDFKDGYYEL